MQLTRPRAALIIVFVLTLLVLGLNLLSQKEPQPLQGAALEQVTGYALPAAQNLMTALQIDDASGFRKDFDEDLNKDFKPEDFAGLKTRLAPLGELKEISVQKAIFDHGTISVYYNLQFQAGLANLNLNLEPDGEHRITRLAMRLAVPVTPTP